MKTGIVVIVCTLRGFACVHSGRSPQLLPFYRRYRDTPWRAAGADGVISARHGAVGVEITGADNSVHALLP
jgi:hypothetical protein